MGLAMAAMAVAFQVQSITHTTTGGTARELTVAVWYPTTATASSTRAYAYTTGTVVEDGPLADGSWPLLVLSHGLDECGTSAAFLAQHIAAAGFIVAAPDHEDASSCVTTGGQRPATWYGNQPEQRLPERPREITTVIDAMQARYPITQVLAAGHSVGGWTIVAAGDPRVQSSVLWSIGPRFDPQTSYARAQAPVLLMYGAQEWMIGTRYETAALETVPAPAYQVTVADAGHYAFTDREHCRFYRTVERCYRYSPVQRTILAHTLSLLLAVARGDATAWGRLAALSLQKLEA